MLKLPAYLIKWDFQKTKLIASELPGKKSVECREKSQVQVPDSLISKRKG